MAKRMWFLEQGYTVTLPSDPWPYSISTGYNYWRHITRHDSFESASAGLKPGGVIYEVEMKREWDGVDPTSGNRIAVERKNA